MQYALLIYGDEKVWESFDEAEQQENHARHQRFMKLLQERDAMRGGAELTRSSAATTVRYSGGEVSVTDGPFTEAGEQLGGFYLVEAADLDDAIALAKALPEGIVEVRPLAPARYRDRCGPERGGGGRAGVPGALVTPARPARHPAAPVRSGRGQPAGRVRGGGAEVAGRGCAGPAGRVAAHRGPASRPGPAAPRGRRSAPAAVADHRSGPGRGGGGARGDRRAAAAALRLLPPGAAAGRPGRHDAAFRRRPDTAEIARLFLVAEPTMSARLTRAKRKMALAGIPLRTPDAADLPARLDIVLKVVYLLFTEGYRATAGEQLTRPRLCAEAIRLGYLLGELLPGETGSRPCSP